MTIPLTARQWLAAGTGDEPEVVVLGAPISKASITPSHAEQTPGAFREALQRFPLWDAEHQIDLSQMRIRDLGDISGDHDDADADAAHARLASAIMQIQAGVAVIIGGDNSLTHPAFSAISRGGDWGLITLDAHHDVRSTESGSSNGTVVRELIESGLPGSRVAQIGIHPFGNHRVFSQWAHSAGIRSYSVTDVQRESIKAIVHDAVGYVIDNGAQRIYIDFDMDVVDRVFAPACPASMPGGLSPRELCEAAFLLGSDKRVAAADLCEVDATCDLNGITLRLMAQVFLNFCAGIAQR